MAASKCLVEKPGLSLCFLCPARVPVANAISHVDRWLERRCRTIGPAPLAFEDFCCVKDRGLTSFYLCPFITCLTPALRFKKGRIPDAERHLMTTHVKTQGAKGNPMTGEVAAFAVQDLLLMNMPGHVFDQHDDGSCTVRVAEKNGRVVCAAHFCVCRKAGTPATTAALEYLCHLVNDHGLPLLRDAAKETVQTKHLGDFRSNIPDWKLNARNTIFAMPIHKPKLGSKS